MKNGVVIFLFIFIGLIAIFSLLFLSTYGFNDFSGDVNKKNTEIFHSNTKLLYLQYQIDSIQNEINYIKTSNTFY